MSEPSSTNVICSQCGATVLEDAKFCGMCGNAVLRASERDPYAGEVVAGRYKIEKRIASGGMGEVYIAKHETLDQRVAVKLLHRRYASDERVVARFFNEARTYCRVKHPHAVGLLDFGRLNDGTLYIVTEYVDGVSLAKLVSRDGSLSTALVVRLGRQLAEVLAAAHQENIVHRDLKPDNVMVVDGPGGRATIKVLDFGIAKILDEGEARLTKTGSVFGTPEYMSPEQAQGQSVDQRSDLYSLGALLFFSLTGAAPFEAEKRTEILQRHISDPPPLNKLRARADVPLALVELIAALLEKRPDKRPADMLAVLNRLEALESSVPDLAAKAAAPKKAAATAQSGAKTLAASPSAKLGTAPGRDRSAAPGVKPAAGPVAAAVASRPKTIEDPGAREGEKTVEDPEPGPTRPVDPPSAAPATQKSSPNVFDELTGSPLGDSFSLSEAEPAVDAAPALSEEFEASFDLHLGAERNEPPGNEGYTWGDEEEEHTDDPFKRSLDLGDAEAPAHALAERSPMPWVIGAIVLVALGFGLYFLIWGAGSGPNDALAGVDQAGADASDASDSEGTGRMGPDAGPATGEADAGGLADQATAPSPNPVAGSQLAVASPPAPAGAPPVPRAARDVIGAAREAGQAAALLREGEVDRAAAAWSRAHSLLSGAGFGEAVPAIATELTRAQELVSETRAALERTECRQADRRIVEMREISPALRRAFLSELHDCNRRRDRQQGRPPRTLE